MAILHSQAQQSHGVNRDKKYGPSQGCHEILKLCRAVDLAVTLQPFLPRDSTEAQKRQGRAGR